MTRLRPGGWPVRWRIAVVSATLTFLILLGFAFVVGRLAADKLEANFHEETQSSASAIANRFEIGTNATGGRLLNPRSLSPDQLVIPDDGQLQIVGAAGELVFAEGSSRFGSPEEEPRDVGDYTVASEQIPTQTLGPAVYVQYARSRDSVEATTDRLWLFLAGGVLGGTLLAALAGMAVAQRAMRPIASLTAAAREVAATRDPSRRLPMPPSDDEVAELARTLDQMLRELDAARDETEQMVQAQREFVADASHELRTPLTSILANLELLQARLGDDVADAEDVEIVGAAISSSRRMRRLVSDLLILARADAGRAGQRRSCDLAQTAADAVGEVRSVAAGHAIEFEAEEGIQVAGNPDDLHRLALNLIENAVRHTPAGTTVRVLVRREGADAVLEVLDNGPGLPAALGGQIFSRFVRGGGPADLTNNSGTGLGLAIVRAVVSSHGGTVEAGSSPEGGARFAARIPLDRSAREGPAREAPRAKQVFSDR